MKIGAAVLLLLMLTACTPTAETLAAEQLRDDIDHWEAMGYDGDPPPHDAADIWQAINDIASLSGE